MNLNPAIFLAFLLVFAAACSRADRAPATPGSATEAPEATANLPRPATTPATVSPVSPTPQPTPIVTPAPTGRPEGLSFHFGRSVDAFDRSLIMRAVEVTRQVLSDESGVEPPAAVFAYESTQELAEAFAEEALAQRWRAEGMAERMPRTIAEASYRGIVINTGNAAWREMDATERLRVVAHEFVHVIQLEHAGLNAADGTFLGPNTLAPPAGPFWLLEGSAEVVSWLVLQELALGEYPNALLLYAADSKGGPTDLSQMEAYFGFAQGGKQGLSISVLATDYLLRSRSLDGLFAFWSEIERGAVWQTAFTRHFGLPPEFFYAAFKEYFETTWAGRTN
jgi:hypothetical protein